MKFLRILLLPFSILYGIITDIRNFMYDKGIFKSYTFPIPVIAVGNLSTGGTGKSPQTEYLIRLLSNKYKVATLSRGYKRKSKGFVLADADANAEVLGDEPFQFYKKFPNVKVAVDANRKKGIEKLLSLPQKPEVIILDDAYQHHRVRADFYILLTAYGDIYADDFILPTGNLRESRSGAKRADVIIVTKCPAGISETEMKEITRRLNPLEAQKVYFTRIQYDDNVYSEEGALPVADALATNKLLVAGIARPQLFYDFLKKSTDECLTFPDHHDFTDEDINNIKEKSRDRIIVTTEKDYVRLTDKLKYQNLYYLPIRSAFINGSDDFNKTILENVDKFKPTGGYLK